MNERHSEAAFETVIEAHLLANGYMAEDGGGLDRQRAIFPDTILGFIAKVPVRVAATPQDG